jgi:hypothetical protein
MVLDQEQLKTLAGEVDEAVRFKVLSQASELSSKIKATLKSGGLDAELIKVLNHYLVELKFIRLLAISSDELFELLTHNIAACYEIPEYDFVEKFGDRFSLITFPEDQAEFLKKTISALESSDELVGDKPLTIGGKQSKQTLGNWISAYNAVPSSQPLRGPLEAINFVQKTGNHLSDDQKLMLNDVLKIYNGAKNWVYKYESLPELGEDEDIPEDAVLDMLYGPDESAQEKVSPSPVSARNIDGVKQSAPVPQQQVARPAQPVQATPENSEGQRLSAKQPEVDSQTASRLQELLHKNLSANAPVNKPAPAPDAIEAKLAELKKRVSTDNIDK